MAKLKEIQENMKDEDVVEEHDPQSFEFIRKSKIYQN
jgi:hypothetical protein